MSNPNQEKGKLTLWSANKKHYIEEVFLKLKELRYKGEYYEEIGLPKMEILLRGLLQDIEILKRENDELKRENDELKKQIGK